MAYYYINKNQQDNGDHEVHVLSCSWLPAEENRIYLGSFTNSHDAVAHAKSKWPGSKINGCYHCCRESHTG